MKRYGFVIFLSILFFIQGLIVTSDYGVNWDAPVNYKAGHAMLHFLTTGKRNYNDVPQCPYIQGSLFNSQKLHSSCRNGLLLRSAYQDSEYPLDKIYKDQSREGSHPQVSGIWNAVFNTVFYRFLGIVDDSNSYHLFPLISIFLLSCLIGIWATQARDWIAGIVSVLVVNTFPLLVAERQFNFKDAPEVFFYTLTLYLLWLGLTKHKSRWVFLSSVVFGLAMGIKFNILLIPFIVGPWLVYFLFRYRKTWRVILNSQVLVSLLFFPLIAYAVFILSWPYTWHDPLQKTIETLKYYRMIGSGIQYQDSTYYIHGFNMYPLLYFLTTMPLQSLTLFLFGAFEFIRSIKKKENHTYVLWMCLAIFPLVRIMLPGMSSYGGVRQILEFIVGFSLIAGLGGSFLFSRFVAHGSNTKKRWVIVLLLVFYLPLLLFLSKIHPYENTYFNIFTNGLKGAYAAQIPGAGDTFGNNYYQGVRWVNEHASRSAHLAYPFEGVYDYMPISKLRSDIRVGGEYWSGPEKKGEYIINPVISGPLTTRYAIRYLQTTLIPEKVISLDTVPMVEIYKNDIAHTKKEFRFTSHKLDRTVEVSGNEIILTLQSPAYLTQMNIPFSSCITPPNGPVSVEKNEWVQLAEPLAEQDYSLPTFEMGLVENQIRYYFVYDNTRRIKIAPTITEKNCTILSDQIEVYGN